MNDDASTFELPEYIHSRLQPTIELPFPDVKEEYDILTEFYREYERVLKAVEIYNTQSPCSITEICCPLRVSALTSI